jgi:starvation-inducible DNA-binding protein
MAAALGRSARGTSAQRGSSSIDIAAKVRTQVAGVLAARLADAIDLHARAKHAHWNVTGPNFIAVHELLDKVAEHAEDAADAMAERMRALGHAAPGLLPDVIKSSTLPAYNAREGRSHLNAIAASLAAFGAQVRAAIDETDRAGDKGTADLFTGVSRENDKLLWFVESHLSA